MNALRSAAFGLALIAIPLSAAQLTGCATASAHLTTSRALYIAELSFNGLATSMEAAVDSGALRGENATKARDLLAKAHATLLLARAGKASSDAVLNAIADAQILVPAK